MHRRRRANLLHGGPPIATIGAYVKGYERRTELLTGDPDDKFLAVLLHALAREQRGAAGSHP